MKEENTNITNSGFEDYKLTPQNTSCTGGTITDIYVPLDEDNSQSPSYTLTLKELRSCDGFEEVDQEEADIIIKTLYQLSSICYNTILNE